MALSPKNMCLTLSIFGEKKRERSHLDGSEQGSVKAWIAVGMGYNECTDLLAPLHQPALTDALRTLSLPFHQPCPSLCGQPLSDPLNLLNHYCCALSGFSQPTRVSL